MADPGIGRGGGGGGGGAPARVWRSSRRGRTGEGQRGCGRGYPSRPRAVDNFYTLGGHNRSECHIL